MLVRKGKIMSLTIGQSQNVYTNKENKSSTGKNILKGVAAGAIGLALLTRGKNPAKIISKAGAKKPPLPPMVLQLLESLRTRFHMALNTVRKRNPLDFLSKSEFSDELAKYIKEAQKHAKVSYGPKISVTPVSKNANYEVINQISTDLHKAREVEKVLVYV